LWSTTVVPEALCIKLLHTSGAGSSARTHQAQFFIQVHGGVIEQDMKDTES
jgi:hypothetical protein